MIYLRNIWNLLYIVLLDSLGNSILFQENKCVLPIGMTCCQDIFMPNLADCWDTCSFSNTLFFSFRLCSRFVFAWAFCCIKRYLNICFLYWFIMCQSGYKCRLRRMSFHMSSWLPLVECRSASIYYASRGVWLSSPRGL